MNGTASAPLPLSAHGPKVSCVSLRTCVSNRITRPIAPPTRKARHGRDGRSAATLEAFIAGILSPDNSEAGLFGRPRDARYLWVYALFVASCSGDFATLR